MIRILSRIPFFWSLHSLGWPHVLPVNYTFSLTFRCNSRCQTCNIWKRESDEELTSQEWRKSFFSLGKSPYWVTLSGGEPFLRKDLVKIVKDLCQICQPKIVTIPTNGILTDKIQRDVSAMLENCPKTRIIINLSLDGIGEKHDQMRGVKGNFEKTIKTFKSLKRIKLSNFILGVHTVISKENINQFPTICNFVLDQLKPDSYVTEIAEQRVELRTMSKDITPSPQDYKRAVGYLKQKINNKNLREFVRLVQAFRTVYYDLSEEILEKKTQIVPCYAGVLSAQIAPNGDVWQCCVRADVLGNLKEENFDFPKIWFSERANRIRESIRNKECYCPLANASYTNILMSPKALGRVVLNFVL